MLQKRVFRIIANIQHIPFHWISTSDLSSLLNLLTLLFLFKHFTSVSGYRIFRGLSPKYFSDSFRASVNTSFNLRDNLKLHPNNITMLDNIIAYTFNDIPLLIPSSLNVKPLKSYCKRFYSTFIEKVLLYYSFVRDFFSFGWFWKDYSYEIYADRDQQTLHTTHEAYSLGLFAGLNIGSLNPPPSTDSVH